jgi:hypothetical protein
MSQNVRTEEIAGEAISNFKQVVDALTDERIDLKTFQATVSEYLEDTILSDEIKIEVVDLTLHALPKAIFGVYYFLLDDVAQCVRVYKRLKKRLGNRKGYVKIELQHSRDNIIFMFQDAFHKNLAEEIAKEEDIKDKVNEKAMATAGDAGKSYRQHLKRDVRKRLKKEEKEKKDDSDDNDDDDDDEDEDDD